MGDTRLEMPATTEQFAAALAADGVKLPVNVGAEIGVLYDADGHDFLTVDVNNERPDQAVRRIAQSVMHAVNTCGGMAIRPETSSGEARKPDRASAPSGRPAGAPAADGGDMALEA